MNQSQFSSQLTNPNAPSYGELRFVGPKKRSPIVQIGLSFVVLFFVAALGLLLLQMGKHKQVYFVNGTDASYTVEVAGESFVVPAFRHVRHKVRLRTDLTATVESDALTVEPVTFRLDDGWFAWLDAEVDVINPDGLAVLEIEQIEYVDIEKIALEDANSDLPYVIHVGKTVHDLGDIDFAFKPFPDEIEMPAGASRVTRSRLGMYSGTTLDLYGQALGWVEQEELDDWVERAATTLGIDAVHPGLVSQAVGADRFHELAAQRLEATPLDVEWHRYYQQALGEEGRTEEAVTLYAELVEQTGSSAAYYLLARIDPRPETSKALLERAVRIEPTSPWAHYGLAYQHHSAGRFADAESRLQAGFDASGDTWDGSFDELWSDIQMARGAWDILLEDTRAALEQAAHDPGLKSREVGLLVAAGRHGEADEAVAAFSEHVRSDPEMQSYAELFEARLAADYALAAGDFQTWSEKVQPLLLWVELERFRLALLQDDFAAARAVLEESADADVQHFLLLHLAAGDADPETASWALEAGIGALPASGEGALYAEALSQGGPVTEQVLVDLPYRSVDKAMILAVLARRGGAHARALQQRARQLAFDLDFEPIYLRRLLG